MPLIIGNVSQLLSLYRYHCNNGPERFHYIKKNACSFGYKSQRRDGQRKEGRGEKVTREERKKNKGRGEGKEEKTEGGKA